MLCRSAPVDNPVGGSSTGRALTDVRPRLDYFLTVRLVRCIGKVQFVHYRIVLANTLPKTVWAALSNEPFKT